MSALFIFAHQDDEMAAASRIVFELEQKTPVVCIFLTDGGRNASPDTRNRESTLVLTSLGVSPERIHFPGSEIPIHDGVLVEQLDVALDRLEEEMHGIDVLTVYCLAWEGGHQDHDASQLVAAAFAKSRGILDRCFEMPLYHGSALKGPAFRVMSPLPERAEWELRRLTFREGLRLSLLAWKYRSQRSSWVGLFPETLFKLAILRREFLRSVRPERYRRRPHEGALFYERRFHFPYERFTKAAVGFVDRHFPEERFP